MPAAVQVACCGVPLGGRWLPASAAAAHLSPGSACRMCLRAACLRAPASSATQARPTATRVRHSLSPRMPPQRRHGLLQQACLRRPREVSIRVFACELTPSLCAWQAPMPAATAAPSACWTSLSAPLGSPRASPRPPTGAASWTCPRAPCPLAPARCGPIASAARTSGAEAGGGCAEAEAAAARCLAHLSSALRGTPQLCYDTPDDCTNGPNNWRAGP